MSDSAPWFSFSSYQSHSLNAGVGQRHSTLLNEQSSYSCGAEERSLDKHAAVREAQDESRNKHQAPNAA